MICQREGFLVLERSLGFQLLPPLGGFLVHCRAIVPEKGDKVPDERELNGFDVPFRCPVKECLGLRRAVQIEIGESHIFVADGEIRIEFDRLLTFIRSSAVMTRPR